MFFPPSCEVRNRHITRTWYLIQEITFSTPPIASDMIFTSQRLVEEMRPDVCVYLFIFLTDDASEGRAKAAMRRNDLNTEKGLELFVQERGWRKLLKKAMLELFLQREMVLTPCSQPRQNLVQVHVDKITFI